VFVLQFTPAAVLLIVWIEQKAAGCDLVADGLGLDAQVGCDARRDASSTDKFARRFQPVTLG
jgi:hypothetical protein